MRSQKTRVLWKRGQSTPRIVVSVSLFLAVLGAGWLIGRQLMLSSTPIPRGVVRLNCEQFELDNETGALRPRGVAAQCDDIRTMPPPGPGGGAGPIGRIHSIGEQFKSR